MNPNIKNIQAEKPIEELINFSIINIDKPTEHTSFDVVARIRKIFGIKKVGHFGTLDPKVTGVLPISLNRACKLSDYFMHHDKEYIGKMYVHKDVRGGVLRKEMEKFIGKIKQLPPVKSSVKRVERERTVNKFKIKEIEGKTVGFHCDVEAGTYIRKLIHDLGQEIGGAHMIKLVRVRAGIFNLKESHTIEEVKEAYDLWNKKGDESKLRKILIPAEILSKILPFVEIKEESLDQLLIGRPIYEEDIKDISIVNELEDEELFILFSGDKFIEVAKKIEKKEDSKVIAKPDFVLN